MAGMATELVLLGTAGAPMPVPGRMGISSVLAVDERVFVVDCGRGSPSGFAEAGLDFTRLEAVFLTHLHADHIGDLPGMLLYLWGVRTGDNGPLAPIRVYGPSRPRALPSGDAVFHRQTTISPRMAALHTDVTQVGGVAERAGVRELILSHYLPAEPDAVTDEEWADRASKGFSGRTTAGHDGLRRTLPAALSASGPP
jgi:ribonuclease BN (tRNA processing enzyme)